MHASYRDKTYQSTSKLNIYFLEFFPGSSNFFLNSIGLKLHSCFYFDELLSDVRVLQAKTCSEALFFIQSSTDTPTKFTIVLIVLIFEIWLDFVSSGIKVTEKNHADSSLVKIQHFRDPRKRSGVILNVFVQDFIA